MLLVECYINATLLRIHAAYTGDIAMNDRSHFSPILADATKYRMLRDVFLRDPAITPRTVEVMVDIFRMGTTPPEVDPNQRRQFRRR
jgi:hypothetical protein